MLLWRLLALAEEVVEGLEMLLAVKAVEEVEEVLLLKVFITLLTYLLL